MLEGDSLQCARLSCYANIAIDRSLPPSTPSMSVPALPRPAPTSSSFSATIRWTPSSTGSGDAIPVLAPHWCVSKEGANMFPAHVNHDFSLWPGCPATPPSWLFSLQQLRTAGNQLSTAVHGGVGFRSRPAGTSSSNVTVQGEGDAHQRRIPFYHASDLTCVRCYRSSHDRQRGAVLFGAASRSKIERETPEQWNVFALSDAAVATTRNLRAPVQTTRSSPFSVCFNHLLSNDLSLSHSSTGARSGQGCGRPRAH